MPRQSTNKIYFLHFHIIGYFNDSIVINEFMLYDYRLTLSSHQLSCMYEFNDIRLVTEFLFLLVTMNSSRHIIMLLTEAR